MFEDTLYEDVGHEGWFMLATIFFYGNYLSSCLMEQETLQPDRNK
jgi:hypothetical protein